MRLLCILILLIPTATYAGDDLAGSAEISHPALIYKKFKTFKGSPIVAATGAEYSQSRTDQLQRLYEERATAICIKYGYQDAAEFPVVALMEGDTKNLAYLEANEFNVKSSRTEVSRWSILTIMLAGVPVWTNPRVYEFIGCVKAN